MTIVLDIIHDLIPTDTSHHWDCEPDVSLHLRGSNHSVQIPPVLPCCETHLKGKFNIFGKSPDYNNPDSNTSRCIAFNHQWLLFSAPEGGEASCGARTT